MKIISTSPKETKKIATGFAKKIVKKKNKNSALIIGLVGDLGAGKTIFIQGFAKALGIRQNLPSPTFIIMRNYKLPRCHSLFIIHYSSFIHVDAYRIKKSSELRPLGFGKILKKPQNIVLIEWADKIRKILPKETIWINFEHGKKENERIIEIR